MKKLTFLALLLSFAIGNGQLSAQPVRPAGAAVAGGTAAGVSAGAIAVGVGVVVAAVAIAVAANTSNNNAHS